MKGYKTSKDHSLLWDLIQKGYRVPGWVTSDKNRHIIEVWIGKSGQSRIESRGVGYGENSRGEYEFALSCNVFDLEFIPPIDYQDFCE